MKESLKIAVIGAGIAGLSSALLLDKQGHHIDLFEALDTPQPVGSGILLQPQGLYVLHKLGLLNQIRTVGAKIETLYGLSHRGQKVMDFNYAELYPDLYGVGIHRGQIFQLLKNLLDVTQVNCFTGHKVTDLKQEKTVDVLTDKGKYPSYDLVIVADGSWSSLREHTGIKYTCKTYPWGALWSIWEDLNSLYSGVLDQRYQYSSQMAGMLPTGKHPMTDSNSVSFFWSLQATQYTHVTNRPIVQWRNEVLRLWPELERIFDLNLQWKDFTFTRYADVKMKQWHNKKIVIIGDAAHAMSPQLGQGANMALTDALVLSEKIWHHSCVESALANYSKNRKKHLHYYQSASRMLTPIFQSNSRLLGYTRDVIFPPMRFIPIAKKHALSTLAGIKPSFMSNKPIHDLAEISRLLNST